MVRVYSFIILLMACSKLCAQDFIQEIATRRESYKHDLITDEYAPLDSADLKDLRFYMPDSNYKVVAKLVFIHDEVPFIIPTYSGKEKKFQKIAQLKFRLNGQDATLLLFKNLALAIDPQYADYLFLPFTDPTNDNETYGGGRYLDLKRSDIKGDELILDFNMAYNPYCAYSDGYNCPIPPPENALEIPIKAGEKKFVGTHKVRKK